MKVVIFGSRAITDMALVERAVEESGLLPEITEIVSGRAKGVDTLGERFASERGIPLKLYPPDYKTFGGSAPLKRNEDMAAYADYGVAVWNGVSNGTRHMLGLMTGRCHTLIVPAATGATGAKPSSAGPCGEPPA
ncbi:MAG: DUF2493 domain-containing protein [Deltaproteobacteria bacterium]|jgi:hypothetical protein|nr:DUF2493 domain-containing protein [Deltaproteobacteria bacterium]